MRIESDVIKTASIVAILLATYAGVVFWPGQKQNQALADQIQSKQTELSQTPRPDLEPIRKEIASLRAELRERARVAAQCFRRIILGQGAETAKADREPAHAGAR